MQLCQPMTGLRKIQQKEHYFVIFQLHRKNNTDMKLQEKTSSLFKTLAKSSVA